MQTLQASRPVGAENGINDGGDHLAQVQKPANDLTDEVSHGITKTVETSVAHIQNPFHYAKKRGNEDGPDVLNEGIEQANHGVANESACHRNGPADEPRGGDGGAGDLVDDGHHAVEQADDNGNEHDYPSDGRCQQSGVKGEYRRRGRRCVSGQHAKANAEEVDHSVVCCRGNGCNLRPVRRYLEYQKSGTQTQQDGANHREIVGKPVDGSE